MGVFFHIVSKSAFDVWKKKKSLFWNWFGLRGDKQSSYGFFSIWQERQSGGEETWGGLYSTPQNKEPEGGERTRPLIYLFAPLLFSGIGKESKKRVQKRERKVIMSHLAGNKRRISRERMWPWDETARLLWEEELGIRMIVSPSS